LISAANTIRNHGPVQRKNAFAYTQELLQLLEQDQDPTQFAIRSRRCNALNSLAIFHYEQGELSEARRIFLEAYQLARELFAEGSVQRGDADCNAAWLSFESGELEQAEARFRSSVDHYVKADGEFGFRSGEAMAYLGRILYERGRHGEARATLRRAIESRRVFLNRMLAQVQTDRELLALVQELRTHNEVANWPGVLDTYLMLASKLEIPADEQYRAVLQWKGVTARRRTYISQREHNETPEIARLLEERAELLEQLRSTARVNLQAYLHGVEGEDDPVGVERKLSDIDLQLAQRSPAFAKEVASHALSPSDISSVLAPDTCLVDIIEVIKFRPVAEFVAEGRGRHYVAFLVRPNGTVLRIDEAEHSDAEAIDEDIMRFGERILDGGQTEDLSRGLDSLNTFADRLRNVAGELQMMIVSPDGKFHQLPFAALYDESTQQYWIESHAIAYCSSARALVTARDQSPHAGRMLLAGDMDYGQLAEESGEVEWFSLPETRFEMAAIYAIARKLRPDSAVVMLSGREAEEKRVTENLANARYVHLATHGYFADTADARDRFAVFDISDLLDSAIVLAGANEPQGTESDQYLTAAELGELDLRGVQLFVLSACETGLGHVSSGQGIVGLLGALERGGVKTMLSSLWQVPESASAQLMEQFYRQALGNQETLAAAESLREAQLRLLGPDRQTAPYDWAAWVVAGDPF
jgi:tetratricopeptide (TPR) repeat protein